MSGLEVVGVVLGAIPLVISALEHYAEVIAAVKVIRRAAQEFRTIAQKLEAEHLIFRNALSNLLSECPGLDHVTLRLLLDAVGGAPWKDPAVEKALANRLGDSMRSYHEHVLSISVALQEFRERLHLGDDGKVPFDDAHTFRQLYKRVQLAFRKSAYMDLITDIRNDSTTLQMLAEQTRSLQIHIGKGLDRMPNFDKIRSSATSVFASLQNALHVSCAASHKASMYLGLSTNHTQAGDNALDEATLPSFRVALHHDRIAPKQAMLGWSVEEAEIRLLKTVPSKLTQAPVQLAMSTAVAGNNGRWGVQSSSAARNTASPSQRPAEIQDLCQKLCSIQSPDCGVCLGYLIDNASNDRHGIFWPDQRLMDSSSLVIDTLDGILEGASRMKRMWTNADARRLAVPLAAGVLRLHNTPWLAEGWNHSNICVIRRNGKLLADHPFVSQPLATMSQPVCTVPGSSVAARIIRNRTLFALGITLIEMCMGKPMKELHTPAELNMDGTKHDLSDYQTASRLLDLEEVSDRFGQRWSNVVRRCIYCDLNQVKTTFESLEFQEAVYNGILAELEEERRQFFQLE